MSESRRTTRRKGRGIDAIFDATDLDLEERPSAEDPAQEGEDWRPERGSDSGSGGRDPGGRFHEKPSGRRGPGRPRLEQPPARELVQRGFYLEPGQDRIIDEVKVGLKGRGFNPDRSAIIRAAVEHFYELDRFEQEKRVRRAK